MSVDQVDLNVLRWASDGRTIEETAKDLNYSDAVIKMHRRKTVCFLGATNFTHAVAIAIRRGYIR